MKMDESIGLGNHVRHDAITGASEPLGSVNSLKCSEDYVTSFVAASFMDQDEPDRREMVGQAPANAGSKLVHQPQQNPPAFPDPPPHPNHLPCATPSLGDRHQSTQTSWSSNTQLPSNQPDLSMYQKIVQPALPIAPPLMHLNFSPPPGLPPQFPVPPAIPPSFESMPTSIGASASSANKSSVAPSHPVASVGRMPSPTNSINEQSTSVPANGTQQNDTSQLEKSQNEQEEINPVEKARLIARRFHIESTQRKTADTIILSDSSIPLDGNYLQKREAHFQKERTKLEKFRLKNLEYVIKRDEIELAQHVNRMNQITAFEEKQNIQLELAKRQQREQQLKFEQKQQQKAQADMMNTACGGLGSKDQQRSERVRKREHLERGTSSVCRSDNDTSRVPKRNSLYLTNLPTDGSTTEGILNSLFSSYGRLDRVTMYRHKSTGELKGDGLIVFGRDALDAYSEAGTNGDLIDVVCMQVREIAPMLFECIASIKGI